MVASRRAGPYTARPRLTSTAAPDVSSRKTREDAGQARILADEASGLSHFQRGAAAFRGEVLRGRRGRTLGADSPILAAFCRRLR